MYRIIDLQGDCGYNLTKRLYKTEKQVLETLISFHETDFDGEGKYKSLSDYIMQYKGINKQLEIMCDYGGWDYKKVG